MKAAKDVNSTRIKDRALEENENREKDRLRVVSLSIVSSFTLSALALMVGITLLHWEIWAYPLIIVSLFVVWVMHIRQDINMRGKTFAYAFMFYAIAFFHGIHPDSMFDSSLIICFIMLLFTMLQETSVINVGIAVYFLLIANQFYTMHLNKTSIEEIDIARIILHIVIVLITSRIAKMTISGRKLMGERYGGTISKLGEMNRRMEDFMANVSHELRTPINVVMGLSKVLLEDESNPSKKATMQALFAAGNRLSGQIGDLLDHTEIDTNKLILSREPYEITSIVNDVISELSMYDIKQMPEIVVNLDPSVPRTMIGDAVRIKKILWHLLTNAVKFTEDGGVYMHIYHRYMDYGVNLCIEVVDTGKGIEPEEKEKMMNGLYQSNSGRNRETGGIGIGLSLVYGFVHAMGGFVTIDSAIEQGTHVRVSIPQGIAETSHCLTVNDDEQLRVGFVFNTENYSVPMLRDFYRDVTVTLVRGLKVPIIRLASFNEFKELNEVEQFTHIFVGTREYLDYRTSYEKLAKVINVAVVAAEDFTFPSDSRVIHFKKPFCSYNFVEILNVGNDREEYTNMHEETKLSFPDTRVLVVDDEEMNLVVAGGILSKYDMQVDTAISGKEAILKYTENDYDAIFMDHMMPEMDGVAATAEIRKIQEKMGRNTVIIALTANAVSGAREMFLSSGFDGFVPKPIAIVELERTLCSLLPKNMVIQSSHRPIASLVWDANGICDFSVIREYCLGDKAIMDKVCDTFIDEADDVMTAIQNAYEESYISDYRSQMIAVRDTARLVGENNLIKMTAEIQEHFLDKGMMPNRARNIKLIDEYRKAVEYIEKEKRGGDNL
ncbi:MAG: response regulator [Lachnospiraceae bacterium]|nr:response regulator [Lachnospiraceae bacterium]